MAVARILNGMNIFTSLLVFCSYSVLLGEANSFQVCPPVNPDMAGVCSEDCSSTSDCTGGTMCCSNGCGHTCVYPFNIPTRTPTLVCPEVSDDTVGLCSEECDDCTTDGKLCCSNGCGHTCTHGVSSTHLCSFHRDEVINSSLIGAYMPQCDDDGNFLPVQCHASTGYCWCAAAETGEPVSDLTHGVHPQCNCSYNGQVYLTGETFTSGEEDCNKCSCTADGEVKCTQRDCPGGDDGGGGGSGDVFYSCPAVRAGASTECTAKCRVNSDCSSALRCCYNGCGYNCMTPHLIPYINISSFSSNLDVCPDPSDLPCDNRVDSCEGDDGSCDDGANLCCDSRCDFPVCVSKRSTPCFTAIKMASSNSSVELLGSYRPQCSSDGQFRTIQCHAHFCWCVESLTGKPSSDIVPFEKSDVLECTTCIYNGVQYRHLENFPSGDGCNTCSCVGGIISCSTVDCNDDDDDDEEELWEWWHSVLVGCVIVVVVLVTIVLALLVGVMILMKQSTAHRHHRLKEATLEHECEMVEYRNGHHESVELKVPLDGTKA